MTQPADSDYDQPSGASGTDLRTNINAYFQGILTKNSGATAPSTTVAGMDWIDTSTTPPTWRIRNQANNAFDDFALIDPSDGIQILNEGAAVPGTGVDNIFTEAQTIDQTGSAGSLTVRSNLTTGIAASIDMGGHDDGGNNTNYASIDVEITDDTNGSEDGQLVFRVLQAGVEVARMTLGATASVTGTLNATTLQQGGTGVSTLIETAAGNMSAPTAITATTVSVPSALTRGQRNRFTGSSTSTWTINSATAGNVYPVRNRGTATINFTAGGGVTIIGGTSLAAGKVCTIEYDSSTTALIYGENT